MTIFDDAIERIDFAKIDMEQELESPGFQAFLDADNPKVQKYATDTVGIIHGELDDAAEKHGGWAIVEGDEETPDPIMSDSVDLTTRQMSFEAIVAFVSVTTHDQAWPTAENWESEWRKDVASLLDASSTESIEQLRVLMKAGYESQFRGTVGRMHAMAHILEAPHEGELFARGIYINAAASCMAYSWLIGYILATR